MNETAETEQTVLGEKKEFQVDYPFSFRGETFNAGERLEVTAEDAKALMSVRTHATIDGGKYHVLAGRVVGGLYTLTRFPDGAHSISFWGKSYAEDDPWVIVEYLEDVHLIANAGDRRRLRRSDALQVAHRYQDSSPNSSTYPGARILILENRPRPAMSAEESAERSAAVMAGMAKDRSDSWTLGNFKRLT